METTLQSKLPPKRGRPGRERSRGRVGITCRVSVETKRKLDHLTKFSGRSQAQEIELQLELALQKLDLLRQVLALSAGTRAAGILQVIMRVIRDVGPHAAFYAREDEDPTRWRDDAFAWDQMTKGIIAALNGMRPEGNPEKPAHLEPRFAMLGELLAQGALEALKNPARGGDIGAWAAPVREDLGEIAQRIRVDDNLVMVNLMTPTTENRRGAIATLGKKPPTND